MAEPCLCLIRRPLGSLYKHRFNLLCVFINGLFSRGFSLPFSTAFSTKRSVDYLNLVSSLHDGLDLHLCLTLTTCLPPNSPSLSGSPPYFPPLTADIFLHLHIHLPPEIMIFCTINYKYFNETLTSASQPSCKIEVSIRPDSCSL